MRHAAAGVARHFHRSDFLSHFASGSDPRKSARSSSNTDSMSRCSPSSSALIPLVAVVMSHPQENPPPSSDARRRDSCAGYAPASESFVTLSQARQQAAEEQAVLADSLVAPLTLQDRLEGGDEPVYLRHGLAQSVLRDLRRGRWVIQGEIDLHGLNRDQARHQVAAFLQTALHQGKRCLRIVHGKGLGSPQKLSVLRQLLRGWLAQRQEVLAYCQAKPQDGGEGALLVLLRAARQ